MTTTETVLQIAEARQLASSGAGRMIRETAGLSGHEVARAINVDASTLWRWENGERNPSGDAAARYALFVHELRDRYAAPRRRVAA